MDTLRLVTFSKGGRPVVVKDLEEGTNYYKVSESFTVKAPAKQQQMSQRQRRYGGGQAVGESHENGSISWQAMCKGASAPTAIDNVEDLIAELEVPVPGRFVEFKHEGATRSTYYAIMGPATWNMTYKYLQLLQAYSAVLDVEIPVAPLAQLAPMDIIDDFSVNSIADYTFDTGSGLAVAGGVLTVSSTAQKEIWHSARGYTYADVQGTIKMHTGASVGATSINGPRIKRTSAGNFLMAVMDQSANLRIYKVVAGTWTGLAATARAIAANTDYWIRIRSEGNVITAEVFTSTPSPMATPATTVSTTLAGGDIALFGAGVEGGVGAELWPGGTDYTYDDLTFEPFTYRNQTLPKTISLGGVIPGTAPALADFVITPSGGSAVPAWALLSWYERPSTPLAGAVAPVGTIEAETATALSGWASAVDATASGGNLLTVTTSGAGTANAEFVIDPATLSPDDFTFTELDLEVWARVKIISTVVSPTLTLSAIPDAGTNFGPQRYTYEWGNVGKLLTPPSSTTVYRMVRLGVIGVVCNTADPAKWRLRLAGAWATGSAGQFAIDRLQIYPARSRVLSPSGKALGSSYPKFVQSTTETVKRIRSDLSAVVQPAGGAPYPDYGLGGSGVIELPSKKNAAGLVDIGVALSSLVPDDPTSDTTSEQLAYNGTVHVGLTPRVYLMQGS